MRITIITTDTAVTFMRRAGYGYQKEGGGEVAFVRRVGGGLFPRYHAYTREIKSKKGEVKSSEQADSTSIEINLHVDQKAPTYGRNSVHSGEYEGTLVEQEAARLRALAQPLNGERENGRTENPLDEKPGFLRRLFG